MSKSQLKRLVTQKGSSFMKLYNIPNNSYIKIDGDVLYFVHIDGAYSFCKDMRGNIVHLAAWADVELASTEEIKEGEDAS